MKLKFILPTLFIILSTTFLSAQRWVDSMQSATGNLYQIQAEFEAYWATRNTTEKGKGYKVFKRWENFAAPRVYPSGNLALLNQTGKNYESYLNSLPTPTGSGKNMGGPNLTASATWTALGPHGPLNGQAGSQILKSGRLNFITIDPTNTLSLWVGAPAGGLWHSTNGGVSWTTNTDLLPVTGCSDLAIDPSNPTTMYLATGDGDGGDTRSIGVLKSTNGGATWVTTGMTNPVSTYFLIRRLIINPNNTQIILAACNTGIYRTVNGGTSWSQVSNQSTYDLEFKPGDPNIVYAGGTSFRLSTNGGASFTQINNGLPSTGFQRLAIAVTPADSSYVYLLGANGVNGGFQGLYRSTSSGTAFTVMSNSTTVNVLGWNTNGQDVGGQGWYDLCLAASPLDKNEIVTGGVNIWRSINGGTTWSIYSHWTGSGAPFSHADQHDLEYTANGTLFNCNDGTVYKRVGSSWLEISGTMNISQIYKIGLSSITPNRWITGHQDNGTSIQTGTSYNAELGGDGMDCFIDRTNDLNVFGEYQNGGFNRTTNGGANWAGCTTSLTGTAPWVTIWKQDPQVANTLYCGRSNLFRSTNLAATAWSTLTPLPASGGINEFAIAPSNNQVIYVLKNNGIYKTTNAGATWSTVTNGVPVTQSSPQFIVIDPSDPNNAWVVLSGYNAGQKIYMTSNGGATWVNYSANLPNLPANCAVYQPGTNDMIYIGMDVGIYWRNSTSTQWTLYNSGLPNVPVSDMEISPATPDYIHAATYGRGVYSASVYSLSQPPVSSFSYSTNSSCAGSPIPFFDQSVNNPTMWSWNTTPSNGVTISNPIIQNPVITFPTPGTYTVVLTTGSAFGLGSTFTQIININSGPGITLPATSKSVCIGGVTTFTASGSTTYSWTHGGGNGSVATYTPASTTVYSVTAFVGGCQSVKTVTAVVNPLPSVGITGPNTICLGDLAVLTGSGAVTYSWGPASAGISITVTPTITSTYSAMGTDANGCQSTASKTIGVNALPTISVVSNYSMICEKEEVMLTSNGALNYFWSPVGLTGDTLMLSPNSSTTYTVTGTDINGCKNSGEITVLVSLCEGISGYENKNGLYLVFPIPTKNKLTVSGKDQQSTILYAEVYDLTGKVLLSKKLELSEVHTSDDIQVENLAAGSYFLKLTGENKPVQLIRFIKQ